LRLRAKAELEKRRRKGTYSRWPDIYINSATGKIYAPHNDSEAHFVFSDTPRYMLLKGGEGGGKSVAGIIKSLNRLRRGMSGIMVSPDLEHFKKSLWPEFKRWCPWPAVIERHRYRQSEGWEPTKAFTLFFHNEIGGYSELSCGGAKESEIASWRGPNVSFVCFDEASRHRTPVALKLFDGRARIPGPSNEPGQLFFTTTPEKHWLYDYFGPIEDNDKLADFKRDSFTATVLTEENKANLEEGFVEKRAQSLTAQEARVFLRAEWESVSDVEKFVNIMWWDACQGGISPLSAHIPLVIAMDANKGSETSNVADDFSMIAVSRENEQIVIRYCGIWQPLANQLMDYEPIENELIRLCQSFAVIEVCYDPYQLHDMATRLRKRGIANFKEFSQQKARLIADKQLQDLIMSRRILHDGNPALRQHIDNANVKKHGNEGIRIVKRSHSLKVDAAVALSMAASRIQYFNL
jgi:hypothetical protein